MNATDPVTAPVSASGLPTVNAPATGAVTTGTVTMRVTLRTPLEIVTSNVSTVSIPADCNCAAEGV